ncbi:hypothetical protein GCM10010967_30430 [Dyadobacter beijingensis]|uniref:Uncharacterized protein n=1 Tax=Dyadobacter beijingensis TaxID=365489 RepID=A0ABQ2I0H7_9BACT|nr:hypothetical protein [Dyadobacter beijingensis]GGM94971.1 hypothetical protein GCM10010967_30430 [Dyadobacter beijingensis]
MKTKKVRQVPSYTIDASLDRFSGENLFPEQLKRANEAISKYGLPKEYYLSQGITPPDSNS